MRYDPILCMMVEEQTKAQDELSLAQKKQVVIELKGYLKKSYNFSDESEYARAYEDLRHMFTTGSRKSISGLFENTVKKTGAQDAKSLGKYKLPNGEIVEVIDRKNVHGVDTIVYKNSRGVHFATVDWFMSNAKKVYDSAKVADANTLYETFAHGNNKHAGVLEMNGKAKVVVWNEGDNPRTGKVTVIGEDTPANRSKARSMLDSASALDKAIATTDGMFASAFGEYTKGAKFKKEKFLKELAGISDAEELAKRIQTLDNELKNNLERLDEAYNVASKDYYAARNEIRSIMDAFSKEAFSLYRKLGIK